MSIPLAKVFFVKEQFPFIYFDSSDAIVLQKENVKSLTCKLHTQALLECHLFLIPLFLIHVLRGYFFLLFPTVELTAHINFQSKPGLLKYFLAVESVLNKKKQVDAF